MKTAKSLPVAVIGGGPVGLAAAAHLEARGLSFLLFEAGNTIASNILSWKHIRVFSPWRYNIDKAASQLLLKSNWQRPEDDALPTGEELYRQYLNPLYQLPAIKNHTLLNAKVLSIGRKNMDKMKTWGREEQPFIVQALQDNEMKQYEARAVIDASGTWNSPNPIGSGGCMRPGKLTTKTGSTTAYRIFSTRMPVDIKTKVSWL
jgi:cation diffusion facilitator CzcD-associated flavoprotein CzcO